MSARLFQPGHATGRAGASAEVDRLFTMSPDLIVVTGFDGYFKRVNPAFVGSLGYTEEEALSRPYREFVHPGDRERTDAEWDEIVHGETTVSFENRYVCKNGSFRWIEWTAAPVPEDQLAYAVGRDVTERRQAEADLREAEERNRALAEKQAALRRVATLVARGLPPTEIFAAVAEEIARLIACEGTRILRYEADGTATVIGGWSESGRQVPSELEIGARLPLEGESVTKLVLRTGRPVRLDDYPETASPLSEALHASGVRSVVGAPIIVEGRLWGAMAAGSTNREPLPADSEARLADFTELLATAISNAESRAELARLANEQAALRRVATLVALGTPQEELFAAVTWEVGQLLPVGNAAMGRYDPDGMFTTVAAWSRGVAPFAVGKRWAPEGKNVTTIVFETGRSARIDDFADASGPVGVAAREAGYRSAVGTPITVEGQLWGVMTASSSVEALPPDTEARLANFTELLATAIANAENRAELARLAEEQAALRRVATLVALGTPPEELFAAVTEEVGLLLGTDLAGMARYESDDTLTVLATWAAEGVHRGGHPLVPGPWPLDGDDLGSTIARTGRSVRIDDYDGVPGRIAAFVRDELGVGASVGSPIAVEGRLWGTLFVHSKQTHQPLPRETESRLTGFTELVATAIANTQARAEVGRLAEKQAALRRVATLVAREASPAEVFSAVTEEVARLIGADIAALIRLEPGNTAIVVAAWGGGDGSSVPVGTLIPLEGENVATMVLRTGRPARRDNPEPASGPVAGLVDRLGITSTVGTPIVVEGRLWGGMTVSSRQPEPLPADTESRIADFAELVATAIANAEARTELTASRARIVAAADETRRRIERDLHDGIQQRLVTLGLELRLAKSTASGDAGGTFDRVAGELNGVTEELREISRGIHPAILSEGGLGPALRTLARRSAIPIEFGGVVDQRLPEPIEVAAYYVVSEAIANATKHANASRVDIDVTAQESRLQLSIRDDGVGGADPVRGSGLVGLRDRVEALGGTIEVESPVGVGTAVVVTLPVELHAVASS